MKLSVADLQAVLDTYDKGVLSRGSHNADDGAYCALECVSLARNKGKDNFTDSPQIVGMPDLRPINDRLSDEVRTQALLPLLAALSDWSLWSIARQRRWTIIVAIQTVQRIISLLPGLSKEEREACLKADTLAKARKAASGAAYSAASAAAYGAAAASAASAYSAASASAAASAAAASKDASDKILLIAVDIWLSAVAASIGEEENS